jgi:hypothetical protein
VYTNRWPAFVPLPPSIAATNETAQRSAVITRRLLTDGCATRRLVPCHEDALAAATTYGFRSAQLGLAHSLTSGNRFARNGVEAAHMPSGKPRRHQRKVPTRDKRQPILSTSGLRVRWVEPFNPNASGVWCCKDFQSVYAAEVCDKTASEAVQTANGHGPYCKTCFVTPF